jgi:nucleoside-diphosphate-sugar epimerase
MRYLVTGAQGFLGSEVVKALQKSGKSVTSTGRRSTEDVTRCDLMDSPSVVRLINEIRPDRIVHCAAQVPKRFEDYQKISSADANLTMLENLLAASDCPMVFVSSMTVYGSGSLSHIVEQNAGHPSSAYGISKWQGEQLLKNDGRPAMVVRLPGLFGPTRRDGLVYNVINALRHDGSLPVLPQAPVVWAAMHVCDAVECITKLALSSINNYNTIHIAYRGHYSINSFLNLAAGMYNKNIFYSIDHPRIQFDLTCAKNLGVASSMSFSEALERFGNEL